MSSLKEISIDHWRRGILLYLEYQSVCPFVRIGSFQPLSRKRVCTPAWNQRGGGQHFLAGEGGANSDDWRDSPAL
jgi:hypothetical protein